MRRRFDNERGSISMNVFDIGTVVVILWCGVGAYKKGFLKASLGFLPMVFALGVVYSLSPFCSKIVRGTPLFPLFQGWVSESLHLNGSMIGGNTQMQGQMIQQMHLPDFLQNALIENNNPVVYGMLKVNKLEDYITGFFANIGINIICIILMFIISYIGAKLFLGALNLVFKLPVLSFFNRISGLVVGTLQGVVILWVVGIALTLFCYSPKAGVMFELLKASKIASVLYENNLLLLLIVKIFT